MPGDHVSDHAHCIFPPEWRGKKNQAVRKLDTPVEKKRHEMNESELRRNILEKKLKALEEKGKAQRQVVKQLRDQAFTPFWKRRLGEVQPPGVASSA